GSQRRLEVTTELSPGCGPYHPSDHFPVERRHTEPTVPPEFRPKKSPGRCDLSLFLHAPCFIPTCVSSPHPRGCRRCSGQAERAAVRGRHGRSKCGEISWHCDQPRPLSGAAKIRPPQFLPLLVPYTSPSDLVDASCRSAFRFRFSSRSPP